MKGERMELNKLYYFYIVAKHQNVTRAAEELFISQPALTKMIKAFEKELGMPLFYKKGRHIYLTEFGEYLKECADRMFAIWDGVSDKLEKLKNNAKNTIKLNVLAATTIVTDAVVEYTKKNKAAIFQIIQNSEVNCDISVTTNSVDFSHLPPFEDRCIIEEKIYLAAPKNSEYKDLASIDLREVKEKGFVNLSGSRLFRIVCDKLCESVGFKQNVIFESDSPATVKNIIKAGAGIGFWPEFSWGEFPSSDVDLIPISNPVCQRELIIGLHKSGSLSNFSEEFYDFLVAFMKKQRPLQPISMSQR